MLGADEPSRPFAEDLGDVLIRIPAQTAPDKLIHVIIYPFRVRKEAHARWHHVVEDFLVIGGPGVDGFAGLGDGEGDIPLGNREFGVNGMGDIGIVTNGIARGNFRAQILDGGARPGAVDHTVEPLGLGFHEAEEFFEPSGVEVLRRHPHFALGMVFAQLLLLLFEQCKKIFGLGVAGVASGNENRVDAGEFFVDFGPFLEGEVDGVGVRIVFVHGRIPDPDVDAVFGADAGHFGHHVDFREMEMRTVVIVVGAGRDQFDCVGAEDNHVTEILLKNCGSPGVVGVDLGAVAQLVTAQFVFRCGGDVEVVVDGGCVVVPAEGAEELADAEGCLVRRCLGCRRCSGGR